MVPHGGEVVERVLAMVSYESGTRVVWDDAKKVVVDNKAAGRLLKREYRAPWKHPFHG